MTMAGKDKKVNSGKVKAAPADGDSAAGNPGTEEVRVAGRLPVVVHGQYIKDLSFENPNAPASLRPAKDGNPVIDINFSMDAQKSDQVPGQDNIYEVSFGVNVTAKKDGKIAFILEIEYGLLASLEGVTEDQAHPMLLVEMPRYMFPFVRQIIATTTQQGGFPPLLLAPVDFRAFYMQRYGRSAPPDVGLTEESAA